MQDPFHIGNAVQQPDSAQCFQSPKMPQPHIMPIPTNTPWNLQSMPWVLASNNAQPDDVMHFNAQLGSNNPASEAERRALLHQKRKAELLISPTAPKQFISEEKIAAHLNAMHISNNYTQHAFANSSSSLSNENNMNSQDFTYLSNDDYQVMAKDLEEKLKNARRITMCEELMRIQKEQKKATFLPEALMNRIEKPCNALVLWQPSPTLNLIKQNCDNTRSRQLQIPDKENDNFESSIADKANRSSNDFDVEVDDDEFSDPDIDEIDDFMDNNNTCRVDFNTLKTDNMDEDL